MAVPESHSQVSHTAIDRVPTPFVFRPYRHLSVRMTLGHAHLGDHDIKEAAEHGGQAITAIACWYYRLDIRRPLAYIRGMVIE